MPWIGAAMSSTAWRNRAWRSVSRSPERAQRRSTHSGSPAKRPPSAVCGRQLVADQSKSPAGSSQTKSPSVATMNSVAGERCSSHHAISHCTQREAAAAGDASSTKCFDLASAASIAVHNSGLADKLVWSRKTRSARSWKKRRPSRCRPACSAGASAPSAAWLYEMKASYGLDTRGARSGDAELALAGGRRSIPTAVAAFSRRASPPRGAPRRRAAAPDPVPGSWRDRRRPAPPPAARAVACGRRWRRGRYPPRGARRTGLDHHVGFQRGVAQKEETMRGDSTAGEGTLASAAVRTAELLPVTTGGS